MGGRKPFARALQLVKSSQKRGFLAKWRKQRAKPSPSSHRAQRTAHQPRERAGACLPCEGQQKSRCASPAQRLQASRSAVKLIEATNYFVGQVKRPTNSSAPLLNAMVSWLPGLSSGKQHQEIKALKCEAQPRGTRGRAASRPETPQASGTAAPRAKAKSDIPHPKEVL